MNEKLFTEDDRLLLIQTATDLGIDSSESLTVSELLREINIVLKRNKGDS